MVSGCRAVRDEAGPRTGSPRPGAATVTRMSSRARTSPNRRCRLPGRCAGDVRSCGSAPGTHGRSRRPGGCGPATCAPRGAQAEATESLRALVCRCAGGPAGPGLPLWACRGQNRAFARVGGVGWGVHSRGQLRRIPRMMRRIVWRAKISRVKLRRSSTTARIRPSCRMWPGAGPARLGRGR